MKKRNYKLKQKSLLTDYPQPFMLIPFRRKLLSGLSVSKAIKSLLFPVEKTA